MVESPQECDSCGLVPLEIDDLAEFLSENIELRNERGMFDLDDYRTLSELIAQRYGRQGK